MKIKAPFWISLSIAIGLITGIVSTYIMLDNVISASPVVVQALPEKDPPKALIKNGIYFKINKTENKIDTLLYNTHFLQILPVVKKDTIIRRSLPDLNTKAAVNLNPKAFQWIIFSCVSLSLCLASSLFIFFLVRELFCRYYTPGNICIFSILIAIVPIIAALVFISAFSQLRILGGEELMTQFGIIFKDPQRVCSIIVWPMFSISLIPVIGIVLVNIGVYSTLNNDNIPAASKSEVLTLLRDKLDIFTFYLGLLVSCSIIGTGLQRGMIIDKIEPLLYPKEFIYSYGIAFSTILTLLVVPAYVYLKHVSKEYSKAEQEVNTRKWWSLGMSTVEDLKLVLQISMPLLISIIQPIISFD